VHTPINTPPALPNPQDYLTSREVTQQYRLSVGLLSTMRCQGIGPRFIRLGVRKVLYLRSDIEAWLQAHAVQTAS
jgi:predicted DNA-binding transcriptional regulator AlpA